MAKTPAPHDLDATDLRILALLQEDATLTVAEVADKVSLSPTPCWRRIQRLEKDGVIRKRVTLLDAARLNAGVTVFVSVKTNQHSAAWLERFAKAVAAIPEIVEFYRMSGEVDYLLRVVVPDIAGYDAVYKKLIRTAELSDVSSSFAMEQLKYTTSLPLHYATAARTAAVRR
jgi:Lrp/AsnC family transcriptional regulator